MDDLVLNLSQNIKKPTQSKDAKPKETRKRSNELEQRPTNNKKRFKPDEHMQPSSKTAKFSSLFKNNPEIPNITR